MFLIQQIIFHLHNYDAAEQDGTILGKIIRVWAMDSMSLLWVAIIINDSGSVLSDGHGIIINWAITICLPSIQQKVKSQQKALFPSAACLKAVLQEESDILSL